MTTYLIIVAIIAIIVVVVLQEVKAKPKLADIQEEAYWQEEEAYCEEEGYSAAMAGDIPHFHSQACDLDEIPDGIGEFGLCVSNPISVSSISANRIYLEKLRTLDGTPIEWVRRGSLRSPNILMPIDEYAIYDSSGWIANIYISPYHKRTSSKAPKGFKIV